MKWYQNKIFKHLFIFLGYLGLISLVQLILNSIITFFHLFLGHPLGVIEQWIFYHAPFISIISKGLALLVVVLFVHIYQNNQYSLKECLLSQRSIIKENDYLSMVFWGLIILIWGNPIKSSFLNINLYHFFWSYLGNSFFWLIDLILVFVLNFYYPLKQHQKWFSAVFFGLLSSFVFRTTYPYAANYNWFFLFQWCAILLLSFDKSYFYKLESGDIEIASRNSFNRPVLFILLILAPLAALFGVDIIWSSDFSYFILQSKMTMINSICAFFVLFLYFKNWYELPNLKVKMN